MSFPGPLSCLLQGIRIAGPLETEPPSLAQQPMDGILLVILASLPGFCLSETLSLGASLPRLSHRGVMPCHALPCCLSSKACHSHSERVSRA